MSSKYPQKPKNVTQWLNKNKGGAWKYFPKDKIWKDKQGRALIKSSATKWPDNPIYTYNFYENRTATRIF